MSWSLRDWRELGWSVFLLWGKSQVGRHYKLFCTRYLLIICLKGVYRTILSLCGGAGLKRMLLWHLGLSGWTN